MLGFLSLSLGIFNLLPIPCSTAARSSCCASRRSLALGGWKLSMRVRERIQQVGFVMLLLLMGFVITNDLLKKVSRGRRRQASGGQHTEIVRSETVRVSLD